MLSTVQRGSKHYIINKVTKVNNPSSITLGKVFNDTISKHDANIEFGGNYIIKITPNFINTKDLVKNPLGNILSLISSTVDRLSSATVDTLFVGGY